jgi:hypothetical protein
MIDYEFFEDEWDELPAREKIQRSMKPEGSLTDHRRTVKANRDGAYKRLRQLKESARVGI